MLFSSAFYTTAILISSGLSVALPAEGGTLVRRVPPDSVDKYTVDWFVANKETTPQPSQCLFYTAFLSDKAYDMAKQKNMITIWSVWNCKYYKRDQTEDNPLREILKPGPDDKDTEATKKYFRNMSEAFARLCGGGTATVMTDNPRQPRMDGIWGTVERPTVQRPDGPINTITACNDKLTDCVQDWKRGSKKRSNDDIILEEINLEGTDMSDAEKRQVGNCPLCAALPNSCFKDGAELKRIYADLDSRW